MDTLLRGLRHVSSSKNTTITTDNNTTSTTANNSDTTTTAATVLLLESPTGTGKSLSLACASLSWLRQCEASDVEEEEKSSDNKETHNNNTTIHDDDQDWLDAWVSPEERERKQLEETSRRTARRARKMLEERLEATRAQIKVVVEHNNNEQHNLDMERLNTRRDHVVRAAVTASRVRERQALRQRQRGQQQKKRNRMWQKQYNNNNNSLARKKIKVQQQQHESSSNDYCVEEDYRSDGESRKQHYSDDDDDDDMLDQPPRACRRPPDLDDEDASSSSSTLLASTLLDGARLDGSCCFAGRNNKNSSNNTPTTTTTIIPAAVGGVHPGSGVRKIVYAARTHSQLSQFVGELRRVLTNRSVRVVALGGRQQLCGHDVLKKQHKTEASLSEACLDLKDSSQNSNKCPLLVSREGLATLALHTLAQPTDIEEAARMGAASQTCAYYASRTSLAAAEVVVLPYSMLLSPQARAAVGLSLQQSLVIVDEAHNLPEAIRSLHACRLTLPVAKAALAQLAAYTDRYKHRLAGRNLMYLGQIRKCLLALIRHLQTRPSSSSSSSSASPHEEESSIKTMTSASELLIQCKLDNVNLFSLLRYLEQSRLPQKLLGFVNAVNTQQQESTNSITANESSSRIGTTTTTGLSKHVSALSVVQAFLEKLTLSSHEGRVVTEWNSTEKDNDDEPSCLRYVLLHPSAQFRPVLREARAVALVGGTLRPFAHVAAEVLGPEYLSEAARADAAVMKAEQQQWSNPTSSLSSVWSTLTTFTCSHVVPPSNVLLECLSVGPTQVKLDCRHRARMTNDVCDELGRVLWKLAEVVPSGMVVFLPSYKYEAHLVRRWKETGLWTSLQHRKRLHREPKRSQQVESALRAYSRDAANTNGALLLSVVGGKMSEGINFANDMARCVLVVGLPYPDITDPELREKMSQMDRAAAKNQSAITGQAYYHNLCMRAVNQCVGRAIRHAKDYAAIVLADFRYVSDPRVVSALPHWLRRGATKKEMKNGGGGAPQLHHSFQNSMRQVTAFFDSKRRPLASNSVTPDNH